MTPGQIIALVRDVAIAAAIGWLVWRVYSDGQNSIKKEDLEVVVQKLRDNAALVGEWHQQSIVAENQRRLDMETVTAHISAQHEPVFVRQPAKGCTNSVPASAAAATNTDPGSGAIDIRPGINAFELKYEAILADCRAEHAQWPHSN